MPSEEPRDRRSALPIAFAACALGGTLGSCGTTKATQARDPSPSASASTAPIASASATVVVQRARAGTPAWTEDGSALIILPPGNECGATIVDVSARVVAANVDACRSWIGRSSIAVRASDREQLVVWDAHGREHAKIVAVRGAPPSWSRDGRRLAAMAGDAIEVWSESGVPSRGVRARIPLDAAMKLARLARGPWRADGDALAFHDGRRLHLVAPRAGATPTPVDVRCDSIDDVSFAPAGDTLAVQCGMRVEIWDTRARRVVSVHESSFSTWSPDGTAFANDDSQLVHEVRDAVSGATLMKVEGSEYGAHVFSPDGKRIAFEKRGEVEVWEVRAARRLFAAPHAKSPKWSADGALVATTEWVPDPDRGGGEPYGALDVVVRDGATGVEVRRWEKKAGTIAWAHHSPTALAIVTPDHAIDIANAATGDIAVVPSALADGARSHRFSPDGRALVWTSAAGTSPKMRVATANGLGGFDPNARIASFVWAPSSDAIVTSAYFEDTKSCAVARWSVDGHAEIVGTVTICGALSPDAKLVASSEGVVDVATGRAVGKPRATTSLWHDHQDASWSADSRFIARTASAGSSATAGSHRVTIDDAATGAEVRAFVTARPRFAWSPRGARIVVDGPVVFDAVTRKEHRPKSDFASTAFALSEDGTFLALGASDGRVFVTMVGTDDPPRELSNAHANEVAAIVWRGDRVASLARDGSVRVYDAPTGQRLGAWDALGSAASSIAFARDGRVVVIATAEGLRAVHVGESGFVAIEALRVGRTGATFAWDDRGRVDAADDDLGLVRFRVDRGRDVEWLSFAQASKRGLGARAALFGEVVR